MKKTILLSLFSATVAFTSHTQANETNKPTTAHVAVNVSDSLKGNLQVLNGDKYAPAKVDPNITHYVVYYTASW